MFGISDHGSWQCLSGVRGGRNRTEAMPSAYQAFVFPSNFLPSLFTHHLLSALSPVTTRSRPTIGLSSCGLTTVSILNLFSLPHVVPATPDHTQGATFGAESPLARAAPPRARHGVKRDASTRPLATGPSWEPGPLLYLSLRPRGWLPLHQSCLSSARGASPRRPAPPGSLLAPSSAPASRSLCGSLMMKTTGHMKAAPLMRVRGLQATWEVADSTAPAGTQRPSH